MKPRDIKDYLKDLMSEMKGIYYEYGDYDINIHLNEESISYLNYDASISYHGRNDSIEMKTKEECFYKAWGRLKKDLDKFRKKIKSIKMEEIECKKQERKKHLIEEQERIKNELEKMY